MSFLVTATTALSVTHYVDLNCTNATPLYTNWTTAATSIQDAVDASVAGDEIVVTNGYYEAGFGDGGSNGYYVEIDIPLNIRSVNGPQFTIIDASGWFLQLGCVRSIAGASLSGFTLTDGYALFSDGGGANGGTLNNCTLTGNWAYFFGGGAAFCKLNNCTLIDNSASQGGGAYECTLNNCTLTGNSASAIDTGTAGGAADCIANNCIFFGNSHANPFPPPSSFCEDCGSPGQLAGSNWSGDPRFVDTNGWANLRLQSHSPCINAGNNAYASAGPDLDGNPRIVGGTVDIGAYEFQSPTSLISYAWLQQYGFPTDGSADFADPDGDGMNNWQEWRCGTDPTNVLSALRLLPPIAAGTNVTVTWQSVAGVKYFVEQSTDLSASPAFTRLASGIPGQAGTTSYTDTNALGPAPCFYRVGVGD